MTDPLPNGAMSGATSYQDVCLDGPSPKAKGTLSDVSDWSGAVTDCGTVLCCYCQYRSLV